MSYDYFYSYFRIEYHVSLYRRQLSVFFFQIIIIVIIFLIFIQFNILILVRVIKEITTLVEPLAEDNYARQIRYDLKFKKNLFSNVSLNNCIVIFPNLNDSSHGVF